MHNRIIQRFQAQDPVTFARVQTTITRQVAPAANQSFDLQGNYQGPAQTGTTTFDAEVSVQPLRGRDREFLPEGQREKEVVSITCNKELQVADQSTQTIGDSFMWNGRTYQVIHRETADGAFRMDINYWEGYAALVPIDSQDGQ